jgi:DAK2 domain fusion protein YloV
LAGAVQHLSRRSETLNNLNVFPVPDGDTGTNMLLTMRSALAAAKESGADTAGLVAAELARGALIGARGNSGVILSQYLRGFARGIGECHQVTGEILIGALVEASSAARSAVSNPVEGTMLTVASDVARVASAHGGTGIGPLPILEDIVREANESVARTRELLPILRQANVVDSGALGLATVLEGLAQTARGETDPLEPEVALSPPAALRIELDSYGYCTEFLVRGRSLDVPSIRRDLTSLGDSLMVVGDDELVRVHLHTFQPGQAIDLALKFGEVDRVKIENMQQQNERLRAGGDDPHQIDTRCGLVAVAVGKGFAELYRNLGAAVVHGGQTLNPSVAELLSGVRQTAAKEYVMLPNNSNVILIAQQAATLGDRPLTVVSTRNLAEGVAAALVFNANLSATENALAMNRGVADVRTAYVSMAVRDARVRDREIVTGAILGIVGEEIEVVGIDRIQVALDVLAIIGADRSEIITLYAGADSTTVESAELRSRVLAGFPNAQADLVQGGQPHHWFILACE